MTSSYVLGSREEANFAQGYAREANGWKTEPATRADKVFASGNLVSTPGDMQLWNRSLLNGTVLSRERLQKMFTVPTAAGPAHTHYANGWFVEPSGVIWHAGTLLGYGTNNMLVPATGYAREADDMLPGTGSNFERDALLRQNPSKHLSDWPTIPRS
jgi:hypothetical protein